MQRALESAETEKKASSSPFLSLFQNSNVPRQTLFSLSFADFGRAPVRQQGAGVDSAPGRGRAPRQVVAAPERPPAVGVQVEPV